MKLKDVYLYRETPLTAAASALKNFHSEFDFDACIKGENSQVLFRFKLPSGFGEAKCITKRVGDETRVEVYL